MDMQHMKYHISFCLINVYKYHKEIDYHHLKKLELCTYNYVSDYINTLVILKYLTQPIRSYKLFDHSLPNLIFHHMNKFF